MVNVDPNSFLMGGGARSATFHNIGDRYWGTIMSMETRQQTDFKTKEPLVWRDGTPRLQLVVTILTDLQEDEDDDQMRSIYIKGQMRAAVRDAVAKARARGLEEGGKLLVQFVGEKKSDDGLSPAKQFFAKYEPPSRVVEVPGGPDFDEEDLPF